MADKSWLEIEIAPGAVQGLTILVYETTTPLRPDAPGYSKGAVEGVVIAAMAEAMPYAADKIRIVPKR